MSCCHSGPASDSRMKSRKKFVVEAKLPFDKCNWWCNFEVIPSKVEVHLTKCAITLRIILVTLSTGSEYTVSSVKGQRHEINLLMFLCV